MNSKEYLNKMTIIQQNLLEYIDNEDIDSTEDNFEKFKDFIMKIKIQDNQHEFKSFLYLIIKISNNHHRTGNFFNKIEKIIKHIKDNLVKYFSNSELFHIFKSNKRILLFLFEAKIMKFDEFIAKRMMQYKYVNKNYPEYFQPEIVGFMKEKWFPKYVENRDKETRWILEIVKEIPEDFYERRKIGENDNDICEIIRKDLLDDFIIYINEKNYKFNSMINPSIYETNNFLLKVNYKKITFIEYASFFGSIKIVNYLILKNISLTPSLWYYTIHGNNAEIIEILEENQVDLPENKSYEEIFIEAIKCHHNDFVYHIQNNYLQNNTKYSQCEIINGLKYYNFNFIENDKINEATVNYLCKYDYYLLVFILLNTKKIDINYEIIQNYI